MIVIFLFLGSGCIECDTHKSVTPQVFCALRGRLWVFLDGGWCRICEAPPLVAWPATEIWPNPITHSTPLRTVSTTLNASRRAVLCANALARMLATSQLDVLSNEITKSIDSSKRIFVRGLLSTTSFYCVNTFSNEAWERNYLFCQMPIRINAFHYIIYLFYFIFIFWLLLWRENSELLFFAVLFKAQSTKCIKEHLRCERNEKISSTTKSKPLHLQ